MTHDVLIIELNEFNADLLEHAAKQYALSALSQVLGFNKTRYRTTDRFNTGYLEPWVQWISVHTGVPSSEHGLKHKTDLPALHLKQSWDTLSEHHVSCGVWGSMNSCMHPLKPLAFFVPDPITTEKAYPTELAPLATLSHTVAKDFKQLSTFKLILKLLPLVPLIFDYHLQRHVFKILKQWLKDKKKFKHAYFVGLCCFDYLSGLLFIKYKQKHRPQCSFLFLHAIAYLQHQHWQESNHAIGDEMLYGLKMLDGLLAELLNTFPDDAMVLHNGLSQTMIMPSTSHTNAQTGRHIPLGNIYSNKILFDDHIYNHEFNIYLFHYIKPEIFKLRTDEALLYEEETATEIESVC